MKIDENTDLEGSNWWTADYYDSFAEAKRVLTTPIGQDVPEVESKPVDSDLLEKIFQRYSGDIPESRDELHPSVREFLKSRE